MTETTTHSTLQEALVVPEITVRLFRQSDAEAFRDLNEAWISKFFRLEDQDHIQLAQPENILRAGGQIIMAVVGEERIGCCALVFMKPGIFEVAKMAVSESYQGRGIGRKILEFTIEQAKILGGPHPRTRHQLQTRQRHPSL
jgi:putative acetyltransferase